MDAFAGLRVIANRVVGVDVVFCVDIATRRRLPMGDQRGADLIVLNGDLPADGGAEDHRPCGIKPGLPVFTT
jgi:hypothetical protein